MRNKIISAALVLAVAAGFIGGALFVLDGSNAEAREGPKNLVVILQGATPAETGAAFGDVFCFTVDLVDPSTGHRIGDGVDCLDTSTIVPIGTEGGFEITNTTTFNLPGGTIVSESLTTVQPSGPGSVGVTHVTGAIPAEGSNQILSGTGRFANAEGRVTINGAVDMSGFGFGAGDPIGFDCVFIINLD